MHIPNALNHSPGFPCRVKFQIPTIVVGLVIHPVPACPSLSHLPTCLLILPTDPPSPNKPLTFEYLSQGPLQENPN